ncbi:hypothetical protein JYU34_010546 [Plutella xylostella]|uniref:Protein cereblon n=1 Tax=Plutella xylostella TaxID=51655 RepID=A0ABQ7QIR1_PLUXY|nr:hypothetical protein JYU34_010546 [Plutella xylostella]
MLRGLLGRRNMDEDDEYNSDDSGPADADEELPEEEVERFDITLPATHSYLGSSLSEVSGREVEPGWRGRLPGVLGAGVVFPGETVPLLLPRPDHAADMAAALKENGNVFVLLAPDETGACLSGYGTLCAVEAAGAGAAPLGLTARARHRVRVARSQSRDAHHYDGPRPVEVEVLPELCPGDPLLPLRTQGYARPPCSPSWSRRLRAADALTSPWPLCVWEPFHLPRVRRKLQHLQLHDTDSMPTDPVALSFWAAGALPLGARARLALLATDDARARLHLQLAFINTNTGMSCSSCGGGVAQRHDLVAMSSTGPRALYSNLGGFMHDIVTVSRAQGLRLQGRPTEECSWFPGYAWSIALCRQCSQHLGWKFTATKKTLRPQKFYALRRDNVNAFDPSADRAAPPPLD